MRLSETGLRFIEHWEGLVLKAYRDSGGIWTIGYGHTGPEVVEGLVWTDVQANQAMWNDVQGAETVVNTLLGNEIIVNQNQFDALVDFQFNTGALAKSTLYQCMKEENWTGAAMEFEKWDHVKGMVLKGLLARREAEKTLFEDLQVA